VIRADLVLGEVGVVKAVIRCSGMVLSLGTGIFRGVTLDQRLEEASCIGNF
jgi:hypothetical protein